jgi:urease accessory protein
MHLPGPSLVRLLQLASPLLPVGAYSYSQGLECAIAEGIVDDEASAGQWIADNLRYNVGRFEAPIFHRMYLAFVENDFVAAARWNEFFLAAREAAEFRAESETMGFSLSRLLNGLECFDRRAMARLLELDPLSFPTAFSFAAVEWRIPADCALQAYLFAWLENQAGVAMKAIPLGQTAGQKLLLELGESLPEITRRAMTMQDEELSNFAPALAIAGARHETQYCRLFRS